jgi:hypothetical protein
MNGLKLGLDCFGVAFEIIIIQYFFLYITKEPVIHKKMAYMLCGVCVPFMTAASLIPNKHYILPVLNLGLIFLISFVFSGKWYLKFFFSVLLIILFVISEQIVGASLVSVTHMPLDSIQNNLSYYAVGLLASKLIVFLLIKILGYKRLGLYKSLSPKAFLGLLLTPVFSLCAMYNVCAVIQYFPNKRIMLLVLFTAVLMCISSFFVFFLFENQIKNEHIKTKLNFAENQITQQMEHYKNLSERQIEIRKLSHDMKNYISGIMGYLKEGKYDEADRHIKKIYADLQNSANVFDTGHPAMDALLAVKKQSADELDIQFEVSVILPDQIAVDALDLCIVLGNGLDNAIEACARIKDSGRRFIKLSIKIKSKYVFVNIENPVCQNEPEIFPKTSKQDTVRHGFGLENIKSVAEKYDGGLSTIFSRDMFQLAVIMKNDK